MIKGEKIYLRPILKKDINYLNEWKNDEETFQYLGGGFMPTSIDQQEKWMDSLIDTSGNNKRFFISNNENVPIGMIGLYDINWINRTCELGIYIGNKNTKGKGYGKEACKLLEQFAKDYLNLRKIKLNVVSDNVVAIQLWNSLDYKVIGELKDERFIKGEYKSLTLMEKFINL
ncbi:GNAT family N-acetyltransferase [Fictibacillus sp. NPDC058756]|uniref:GNAT family N-acetyltransferase n=1 Tax=Fictibacillus sp. NPDC058756 TaxID=3346625 RepID=UPI0036BE72D4